jgi:Fur family ferric uptake transcriptional regulator/Fur family peroxide stress response transcriptional regulator
VEDFLLKNLPELDLSPAMQAAAERSGWALEGFRLEFRSKCPNCQK